MCVRMYRKLSMVRNFPFCNLILVTASRFRRWQATLIFILLFIEGIAVFIRKNAAEALAAASITAFSFSSFFDFAAAASIVFF